MIKVSKFYNGVLKHTFLKESLAQAVYDMGKDGYITINHPLYENYDMVHARDCEDCLKFEDITDQIEEFKP